MSDTNELTAYDLDCMYQEWLKSEEFNQETDLPF